MSLLDDFYEPCVIMKATRTADGEGGNTSSWAPDKSIRAAIVMDSSTLAKIAERDGVTSVYTITTQKDVKLSFHDVVKRISDGVFFRVTSQPGEKKTPESAYLNMAQVTAERWKLT